MLKPFCDVCGKEILKEIRFAWSTESHTMPNICIQIRAHRVLSAEEADEYSPIKLHTNIENIMNGINLKPEHWPHVCVNCAVEMAERVIATMKESPDYRKL